MHSSRYFNARTVTSAYKRTTTTTMSSSQQDRQLYTDDTGRYQRVFESLRQSFGDRAASVEPRHIRVFRQFFSLYSDRHRRDKSREDDLGLDLLGNMQRYESVYERDGVADSLRLYGGTELVIEWENAIIRWQRTAVDNIAGQANFMEIQREFVDTYRNGTAQASGLDQLFERVANVVVVYAYAEHKSLQSLRGDQALDDETRAIIAPVIVNAIDKAVQRGNARLAVGSILKIMPRIVQTSLRRAENVRKQQRNRAIDTLLVDEFATALESRAGERRDDALVRHEVVSDMLGRAYTDTRQRVDSMLEDLDADDFERDAMLEDPRSLAAGAFDEILSVSTIRQLVESRERALRRDNPLRDADANEQPSAKRSRITVECSSCSTPIDVEHARVCSGACSRRASDIDSLHAYCSQRCQREHWQTVHLYICRVQLPMAREIEQNAARRVIDLLNQRTLETSQQAVDLIVSLVRVQGQPIASNIRVLFLENNEQRRPQVTLVCPPSETELPCTRLQLPEFIETGATDGVNIYMNRVTLTERFEQATRGRGRFARPPFVTHYAAIVLHELGHIYHIRRASRSLFVPAWNEFLQRTSTALVPNPQQLRQFIEEAADCFATAFIAASLEQ